MSKFQKIENNITLGPQPSEQDLDSLKKQGVKTVIDFRLPGETPSSNKELVQKAGLDYINIPVDKSRLSTQQVSMLDNALQNKESPFLLHCASGLRAATLYMLSKAAHNRWTTQQVIAEATKIGFDLHSSPEIMSFVERYIQEQGKQA